MVQYWVAQFLGALAGAGILYVIATGNPAFQMGEWALGSNGFGEGYLGGYALTAALVFEIVALSDADKSRALAAYARERGFRLSDDVIGYLLAHGRRDMPTLVATLAALDRHSLATRRPITVALLRDWLQKDPRLAR